MAAWRARQTASGKHDWPCSPVAPRASHAAHAEHAVPRCVAQALSQLWLAVLRYDWGGRSARRSATAPLELQQLLSDPHVKVGGVCSVHL